MKIIISRTGTARKNSTMTPATQRMGAILASRPTPKMRPKPKAPTMARAAALSVLTRPGRK